MYLSAELAGQIDFSKLSEAATLEKMLPHVQRRTRRSGAHDPASVGDSGTSAMGIMEDFAALGRANEAASGG